ncbi:uncharacterized protein RJT20DRAFT_15864 [Scheffersomyces xylosifermentans]|uniref:uncharacterized protein n=1 Tax=Scheffersomyces xylosifermentans TaxID=1304137 RepID=UPI00315CEF39
MNVVRSLATSCRIRQNLPSSSLRLEESVNCFIQKVKSSQENSSGSLLSTVDMLIDKHNEQLSERLGIARDQEYLVVKQNIWNKLNSCNLASLTRTESIEESRTKLLKEHRLKLPDSAISSLSRFTKCLYPLKKVSSTALSINNINKTLDIPSTLAKYESVNHEKLFGAFYELPSPQPFYLPPDQFKDFLSRFLFNKHDFVKPNIISLLNVQGADPYRYFEYFNQMLNKREEYVRMVTRIVEDCQKCGLEISLEEHNQIIFYTFFKDRYPIIRKLHESVERLKEQGISVTPNLYHDFDLGTYDALRKSLKLKYGKIQTSSLNVFLLHAIRHYNEDILKDILSSFGLSAIVGEEQNVKRIAEPDSKTFTLLLEHFSSPEYVSKYGIDNYFSTIEATNGLMNLDINLVNTVIKSLCVAGNLELAERIVSQLFLQETPELQIDESEALVYKQMTPEDKLAYRKLFSMFSNLKAITHDIEISFTILPTESTFKALISAYCQPTSLVRNSFLKVNYLINFMETYYKLPATTRIYQLVFKKFESSQDEGWQLHDLVTVTSKLISMHDYFYNLSEDTSLFRTNGNFSKLEKISISPQLKNFIDSHLIQQPDLNIPVDRGGFFKLSDSVISSIYHAFMATLRRSKTTENSETIDDLLRQIQKLYEEVRERVANVRGPIERNNYSTSSREIYTIDEINYIKKGFLVDLIDIVG